MSAPAICLTIFRMKGTVRRSIVPAAMRMTAAKEKGFVRMPLNLLFSPR